MYARAWLLFYINHYSIYISNLIYSSIVVPLIIDDACRSIYNAVITDEITDSHEYSDPGTEMAPRKTAAGHCGIHSTRESGRAPSQKQEHDSMRV